LENVASTEALVYRSLVGETAVPQNIAHELESFKPQIVHFEGYLNAIMPELDNQGITFALSIGDQTMPTHEFAQLLKTAGVQLLMIGRSDIVSAYGKLAMSAALLFSDKGLPAVIAPIRAIDDASATTFTTEFYRAFLQGKTVESALHIARRKLASKGGDWSVFALFANPEHLDHLELLRETLA
jgi:hypothetical protein